METHGTALRHVGLALVIVALLLSAMGGGVLRWASSPSPTGSPQEALTSALPAIAAGAGLTLAEKSLGYDPRGPSPGGSGSPLTSPPTLVWHNVSGETATAPEGRYLAAFAWDTADHEAVLFGGSGREGAKILGDTWTYGNGTWTNLTATLPQAPSPRYAAQMAFDPTSQRLVLFGGLNATTKVQADTWAFSHGVWTNITTQVSGAPPVGGIAGGVAATDWAHSRMVLFGGETRTSLGYYPFLYAFQGNAWTNLSTLAGPRGRIVPTMAYDPTHQDLVLFGGEQNNTYILPDTWTLNGSQWTNVSSFPPGLEMDAFGTLAWSPALHGLLLIGGVMFVSRSAYIDAPAWLYQSGIWTNVSGTVASAGTLVSQFVEDPSTGALLMAGGYLGSGVTYWDTDATWVLSAPLHLSATRSGGPAGTTVDVGIPVSYDVQVSGGVSAVATSLSWGDLSVTTWAGTGNYTATHRYTTPGPMLVTLNGTDLVGDTPSTAWIVNVMADPSVRSLGPSTNSTVVGGPISFSPTISGGTAPFSYAWSFGDGSVGTGAAPVHNYTHPGTYLVKLTMRDGDNLTATGTVSVNVSAQFGGSSSSASPLSPLSWPPLALLLMIAFAALAGIFGALWARGRKGRARAAPPPGAPPPA